MAGTATQNQSSNLKQDEVFLRRSFHRSLLPVFCPYSVKISTS